MTSEFISFVRFCCIAASTHTFVCFWVADAQALHAFDILSSAADAKCIQRNRNEEKKILITVYFGCWTVSQKAPLSPSHIDMMFVLLGSTTWIHILYTLQSFDSTSIVRRHEELSLSLFLSSSGLKSFTFLPHPYIDSMVCSSKRVIPVWLSARSNRTVCSSNCIRDTFSLAFLASDVPVGHRCTIYIVYKCCDSVCAVYCSRSLAPCTLHTDKMV